MVGVLVWWSTARRARHRERPAWCSQWRAHQLAMPHRQPTVLEGHAPAVMSLSSIDTTFVLA